MKKNLTLAKRASLVLLCLLLTQSVFSHTEVLELDIIDYHQLTMHNPDALQTLDTALHEKGIVGIRGIPGYVEKLHAFIDSARAFSALPQAVKETYAPNHDLGETFLGYESGKEKFQRPDGVWVVDDLKESFYGFVPDCAANKWPGEGNLRNTFQDLGKLMADMGTSVMEKVDLIGERTHISLDGVPRVGRMLTYKKNSDSETDNPYWCGAHYDHGIFTTILPAFYFSDGQQIPEPEEAGLFVKTTTDGCFRKVAAHDEDIMMFQVGEFGQLVSNDAIRATEHCVFKASGNIERYTMALFFEPPPETMIHSTSVLTADARYGGSPGDPCFYSHWSEESFKRYHVK